MGGELSYKVIKDVEQVSTAEAMRIGSEVRDVWKIYDENQKLLCTAYCSKIANRVAEFLEKNSKYGRDMKHEQEQRVLRSIFLDPQTDSEYRRLAFMMGSDRQELMRLFLDFGKEFLRQNITKKGIRYDVEGLMAALNEMLESSK